MKVFQDDVCFGRGHFRTAAEINDNELTKFRRILSNHMHEEILPSCDKENVSHLSHSFQPFGEGMDHTAGICLKADPDDRLKRVPHRRGVDVSVEPPDHATGHQCPHSTQAG